MKLGISLLAILPFALSSVSYAQSSCSTITINGQSTTSCPPPGETITTTIGDGSVSTTVGPASCNNIIGDNTVYGCGNSVNGWRNYVNGYSNQVTGNDNRVCGNNLQVSGDHQNYCDGSNSTPVDSSPQQASEVPAPPPLPDSFEDILKAYHCFVQPFSGGSGNARFDLAATQVHGGEVSVRGNDSDRLIIRLNRLTSGDAYWLDLTLQNGTHYSHAFAKAALPTDFMTGVASADTRWPSLQYMFHCDGN